MGEEARTSGAGRYYGLVARGLSPMGWDAVDDLGGSWVEAREQQSMGSSSSHRTDLGVASRTKDRLEDVDQAWEGDWDRMENAHQPYVAEAAVEVGRSYCCCLWLSSCPDLAGLTECPQQTGLGSDDHSWGPVGLVCRAPSLLAEAVGLGNQACAALYRFGHLPAPPPAPPSGGMAGFPSGRLYQSRNGPTACDDRAVLPVPHPVVVWATPFEAAARDQARSAGGTVDLENRLSALLGQDS